MTMRGLALAAALLLPAAAAAQEGGGQGWGGPTADYSADMVFTDERGRSRTARLYYTAQAQRLEYQAGKEIVAAIYDRAAGRAWQLLLNRRGWRPIPPDPPAFNFGVSDPASKRRRLAEERMAGRAATKYRVSSRTAAGDAFDGLAWATGQRIVLRMEGTVTRGTRTRKMTLELRNLKIGPVDPALFRVPAHYRRLPPMRQ